MEDLLDIVAEAKVFTQRQAVKVPRRVASSAAFVQQQTRELINKIRAVLQSATRAERQRERGIAGLRKHKFAQVAVDGDTASNGAGEATPPAKSDSEVAAISEQLRQLREQMELLSAMKVTPSEPEVTNKAVDESGPQKATSDICLPSIAEEVSDVGEEDRRSSASSSTSSRGIPEAQPLFFTERSLLSTIPPAPPLPPSAVASDVPPAPPLKIECVPKPTASEAPKLPRVEVSVLEELSASLENISKGERRQVSTDSSPKKTAESHQCYVRNIPGSDSMSFSDLVKVSARIPLRKTNNPRSPGGTPIKRNRRNPSNGNLLASALFKKFKSARQEPSPDRSASRRASLRHHRRMSSRVDVKPYEWDDAADSENRTPSQ